MGGLAPQRFLLGEALAQGVAGQAAPGLQVDLQQLVAEPGLDGLAVAAEQVAAGVGGPAQGGAVNRLQGQIGQRPPGGQGLVHALRGESAEVVAALDAVLDIEAAEPVADQHNPE